MSKTTKITRRRFLAMGGGALGASALACCGLTRLAMQQPAATFIESNCGSGPDNVLVAYASRCGSTGEMAQTIAAELCAAGAATDVRLLKNVNSVEPYAAVIVGSAIRMDALLPETVEFVKTHQAAWKHTPSAYFIACGTLKDDTEENRRKAAAYLDPLRSIAAPTSEGLFAGAIDYDNLSIGHRLILELMGTGQGDFRNWGAIRAWAADLPTLVLEKV